MPNRTFIACARTDCKWNTDGQCDKSEIFVDDAVSCASYEPEMSPMAMMGTGPPGAMGDPRAALLAQMAAPAGPPGAMPLPAPVESPTAAPVPRRF